MSGREEVAIVQPGRGAICAQRARRSALTTAIVAMGIALCAVFGACGPSTGSPDVASDIGSVDVSGQDTAMDVFTERFGPDVTVRVQCTTAEPGDGSFCDTDALECTYGVSDDFGCRRSYRCINQRWTVRAPSFACGMAGSPCPAVPPTGMPATNCGVATQACTYSGGAFCVCGNRCSDGGVGMTWACAPSPAMGCPARAPNLGTFCLTEGQRCVFGPAGSGLTLLCRDGHWESVTTMCN